MHIAKGDRMCNEAGGKNASTKTYIMYMYILCIRNSSYGGLVWGKGCGYLNRLCSLLCGVYGTFMCRSLMTPQSITNIVGYMWLDAPIVKRNIEYIYVKCAVLCFCALGSVWWSIAVSIIIIHSAYCIMHTSAYAGRYIYILHIYMYIQRRRPRLAGVRNQKTATANQPKPKIHQARYIACPVGIRNI